MEDWHKFNVTSEGQVGDSEVLEELEFQICIVQSLVTVILLNEGRQL